MISGHAPSTRRKILLGFKQSGVIDDENAGAETDAARLRDAVDRSQEFLELLTYGALAQQRMTDAQMLGGNHARPEGGERGAGARDPHGEAERRPFEIEPGGAAVLGDRGGSAQQGAEARPDRVRVSERRDFNSDLVAVAANDDRADFIQRESLIDQPPRARLPLREEIGAAQDEAAAAEKDFCIGKGVEACFVRELRRSDALPPFHHPDAHPLRLSIESVYKST